MALVGIKYGLQVIYELDKVLLHIDNIPVDHCPEFLPHRA